MQACQCVFVVNKALIHKIEGETVDCYQLDNHKTVHAINTQQQDQILSINQSLSIAISKMESTSQSKPDYKLPVGQTEQGLPIYKLDPKFRSNWSEPTNEDVIGPDNRKMVKNNHVYPYYCIGLLVCEFDNTPSKVIVGNGTATLVSPNVILTCAHNIFKKKRNSNKQASKITFFPGRAGEHHLGEYQVELPCIFPIEYSKGKDFSEEGDYDWAFLKLDRPVVGLTPIPMIVDYPQTENKISIYGYPADRLKEYLHGMDDSYTLNSEDNNQIEYELDTYNGQSGSSILILNNDGNVLGVIGVHTRGSDQCNYGNRLTLQKFSLAQAWMLEHHKQKIGAPPRIFQL